MISYPPIFIKEQKNISVKEIDAEIVDFKIIGGRIIYSIRIKIGGEILEKTTTLGNPSFVNILNEKDSINDFVIKIFFQEDSKISSEYKPVYSKIGRKQYFEVSTIYSFQVETIERTDFYIKCQDKKCKLDFVNPQ
ncbi:MAG: hypothetical protein GY793_02670 [Proteobacteria bacterium]|nr:hypothetical protein [Pseudomonadota bacterium]